MKLFTKDPLDAARDSKTKLAERLAAAETAVIEKKATTKRLSVEGADDKSLDVAEAAVRVARDRVGTLTVAIREVENTISVLETEQAAAADQKVRAATVVELEAIERDLTKTADEFTHAAKKLSEIAGKISPFIVDAAGLAIFAASAGGEVPPNVAMLRSLLRSHASAVISGHGRATLPLPAPAATPAPPPPALVEVVAVKNVAFLQGGVVKTSHPGYKLALLPEIAANALKIGACVEPSDSRAKHHADQRKVTTPLLENCVGLDEAARRAIEQRASSSVVPIMRSPLPGVTDAMRPLQHAAMRSFDSHGNTFEVTVGKPYAVSTPAGNPAPGQKGIDDEK